MEQSLEEGERGIWREEESKLELTGETAHQLSRSLILTQVLSVLGVRKISAFLQPCTFG